MVVVCVLLCSLSFVVCWLLWLWLTACGVCSLFVGVVVGSFLFVCVACCLLVVFAVVVCCWLIVGCFVLLVVCHFWLVLSSCVADRLLVVACFVFPVVCCLLFVVVVVSRCFCYFF